MVKFLQSKTKSKSSLLCSKDTKIVRINSSCQKKTEERRLRGGNTWMELERMAKVKVKNPKNKMMTTTSVNKRKEHLQEDLQSTKLLSLETTTSRLRKIMMPCLNSLAARILSSMTRLQVILHSKTRLHLLLVIQTLLNNILKIFRRR